MDTNVRAKNQLPTELPDPKLHEFDQKINQLIRAAYDEQTQGVAHISLLAEGLDELSKMAIYIGDLAYRDIEAQDSMRLEDYLICFDWAERVKYFLLLWRDILFEEHKKKDYKLSKFACFLISIHADGRKEIVKKARAYFLNELEEMHLSINEENFLKRNLSRNLLKELNKDFMRIARKSHVKDFQYFTNEGYLGLYNNTAKELKKLKEIAAKCPVHKMLQSEIIIETELIN